MSLIVLSNRNFNESVDNGIVGGIKQPYSFTNTLQTPLVIPADSEVALQSVKLNKEGLFSLDRSNSQMYQYIGRKLTDSFTFDKSPRHPGLIRVDPYGTYTAESFVKNALKPNMNTGLYHPNFQNLANASVRRGASNEFLGFNLTYDKSASAKATANTPPGDLDVIGATLSSKGWSYDGTTNYRLTKTSGNGSVDPRAFVQFTNYPISLADGSLEVDFGNASSWNIGLSRYCNPEATYQDGKGKTVKVDHTEPSYFKTDGFFGFYDFMATCEFDFDSNEYRLRVYHSVKTPDNELSLQEVEYYGDTSPPRQANFAVPYNFSTNASGYNRIHFNCQNEIITLSLSVAGASKITVCAPSVGTPQKNNYFKPIAQTCCYLYPKMEVNEDLVGGGDGKGDYLEFHEYKPQILDGFYYGGIITTKSPELPLQSRLLNYDWWVTLLYLGTWERYCKSVDMREFNDMTVATQHDFQGTTVGKVTYDVVPVLAQSQEYQPTLGANIRGILGFTENALRTPSSTNGSAVTFSSNYTPVLQSNESLFVRLSSLTQRSINGVTGNESKIIYHCPRFDNAGNEIGGLFFEPGEKTYLDVGNISKTPIGSFSIEIVDMNEKPVKSLVGRTVVVLHIREKGSHEGKCHPMKC
jgi:hypothetical protein